jgi:hypothetical protein
MEKGMDASSESGVSLGVEKLQAVPPTDDDVQKVEADKETVPLDDISDDAVKVDQDDDDKTSDFPESGEEEKPTPTAVVVDAGDDEQGDDTAFVPTTFPQRAAVSMARRPWQHLCSAFVITLALSIVGLIVGKFSPKASS